MTITTHIQALALLLLAGIYSPSYAASEIDKSEQNTNEEQDIVGDIPEAVDISNEQVISILKKAGYSRIKVIEVDYEIYQGKKIYEVDFRYKGKEYEAAISLSRKFLYAEIDGDD